MEQTIESIDERCVRVLNKAFWLAYESNGARQGWENHTLNTDIVITNPQDVKQEEYYLIDVYLTSDLAGELIDITEGLPCFIDLCRSGRCSIHDMLHRYTPENLEKRLDAAEEVLKKVEDKRIVFQSRQNLCHAEMQTAA